MNVIAYPAVLLLPLFVGLQGGELTAPIVQTGGRTAAVETSVAVYDVHDIIRMRVPETDKARDDLEKKIERYLRNQEDAQRWRGMKATDAKAADSKAADPKAKETSGVDMQSPDATLDTADLSKSEEETKALAGIAQRYMQPAFAADHEQLEAASEGMLVANLGAEQHAWLSKFLRLQKSATGVNEVAALIIEGPRGVFREVGIPGPSTVFQDPAAVASLRERIAHDARFKIVSNPRLATPSGRQSSISVLDQVAYVKDWKITIVEPGPQEIADPTIDIVQDGFVIDMRTTALAENSYGLDVAFKVSKLERPMASRKIRISASNDKEVEIGVPVVTKLHFESSLILSDGASAAFTTASPERDKDLAIILTLKHHAL